MSVYLDKAYEIATEYMSTIPVEKTWQGVFQKMSEFIDSSHYLSLPCDKRLAYMDVWKDIHNEFFEALRTEEIYQDTNRFYCVISEDFFENGDISMDGVVFISFDNLVGQEHLSFDQLILNNYGSVVPMTNDYGDLIMEKEAILKLVDKYFQPLSPSIPLSDIQPTINNTSNTYNGVQLSASQYYEVAEANNHRLHEKQMDCLNNPSLHSIQIHEIAYGFYNGVSLEQAQNMINNGLSGEQINAISNAVALGCTNDEIANLISSNDRPSVMHAKTQGVLNNYASAELDSLFELSLSDSQIAAINKGLRNQIPTDSLFLVANPCLDFAQTDVMVSAFSYGFTKNDVVEMDIANMNFPQTRQVSESMAINTPKELISTFANPSFTAEQMVAVKDAIEAGISQEAVKVVANFLFSPEQMRVVTEAISNQVDLDLVKELANPSLSAEDMREELAYADMGGIE